MKKQTKTTPAGRKVAKVSSTTKTAAAKGRKRAPAAAAPKVKVAKRPARSVAGTLKLPAVGSKLTRAYKGKEIVVEIVDGGFKYQGETFTSLSALAKKITGYPAISGPAFFGLWKRAAEAK